MVRVWYDALKTPQPVFWLLGWRFETHSGVAVPVFHMRMNGTLISCHDVCTWGVLSMLVDFTLNMVSSLSVSS